MADLGSAPLSNAYLTADQLHKMEATYPLRVYICDQCWLAQLESFTPAEDIFGDYAYFSSYSTSWLQHVEDYVVMAIERFNLTPQSQVLELASNDGYLLQYFIARGIPVLGIEPAVNVAEVARAKDIPTLTTFFGAKAAHALVAQGIRPDLVIANNVLAHVPDLHDFVAGMRLVIAPHGTITIELPHLLCLIEGHQFDTIYHEHFSYFSVIAAQHIFAAHQLVVFDVEELPTHGGSLRLFVRPAEDTSRPVSEHVTMLIGREMEAGLTCLDRYLSYAACVETIKHELLSFLIQAKRMGKRIVGYGAPAKGNTLLNYCGIRQDFLDYTVDRSPHKQGHFLPGSRIPIYPPAHIYTTRPDYVLILPWNLQTEIMHQMDDIRSWGARFVVPIPRITVYS
jgi:2-polyprenyl-3-methyl-5-hydroxy-6-metoxy-1,4-benzoquinol methylase